MVIPLQVTFRGLAHSDAIEEAVREKVAKLGKFYPHIMGCRVGVEAVHHRHRQGNLYHVRVDITVPGGEIAISRDPSEDHAHEDIHVAIRDVFDAARRRLQDYARKQRGDVKLHEGPPHGRVVRLFPDAGYGFLQTADGRELYFSRNSVLDRGFDDLEVGTEVRFEEEEGLKGPQASTVAAVGKQGPRAPA